MAITDSAAAFAARAKALGLDDAVLQLVVGRTGHDVEVRLQFFVRSRAGSRDPIC